MRNKYEELEIIDETMTEPVTVNKKSNNNNNINNNSNSNGLSVAMEESTASTEELTTGESDAESLGYTQQKGVGSDKDKTKQKETDKEADDADLKSKYVKLIEHNSKLVDLLKTTMQIQTDMFRKLIHYVFP